MCHARALITSRSTFPPAGAKSQVEGILCHFVEVAEETKVAKRAPGITRPENHPSDRTPMPGPHLAWHSANEAGIAFEFRESNGHRFDCLGHETRRLSSIESTSREPRPISSAK